MSGKRKAKTRLKFVHFNFEFVSIIYISGFHALACGAILFAHLMLDVFAISSSMLSFLILLNQEYVQDGIDWARVDFEDNQDCLNLFEKVWSLENNVFFPICIKLLCLLCIVEVVLYFFSSCFSWILK